LIDDTLSHVFDTEAVMAAPNEPNESAGD